MLTDIQKHRDVLTRILREIVSDARLNNHLGFKGGTALYFLENLPRFSTDLDFDLIAGQDDNCPGREEVFEAVVEILSKYGEIRDQKIKRHRILVAVAYDMEQRNVKVEINTEDYGARYEQREWLNSPLLVMVREDQFANKLIALTRRPVTAGRDVFDIGFMFNRGWEINPEIVESQTGESLRQYLENSVLPTVQEFPIKEILNDVGELIQEQPEKIRSWVEEDLKDDIDFHIRRYLQRL